MFEKLSLMIRIILGKIIIKVLLIPVIKIWFDRIIQLYEAVQVEKELDMFNRKLEVRLNFRHYPPDTEERIERLRRVINKRPVAIILLGPSATELEERITELEDCDICYCGLNAFRPIEKYILQKINRNLSLFMCTSHDRLYQEMNNHNIIDFLERQEDNIFISERRAFGLIKRSQGFDLDEFIKKYDRKILFVNSATTVTPYVITRKGELFTRAPSMEYPLHFLPPNSFAMLLSLVVIGEAPMVVIFGGDGGRINRRELNFRECGSSHPESVIEQCLMRDTGFFNATMPLILEKIYKIYNLRPVDIVNCSLQSHYTPLRKLSYDETFALLKSFKKDTGSAC